MIVSLKHFLRNLCKKDVDIELSLTKSPPSFADSAEKLLSKYCPAKKLIKTCALHEMCLYSKFFWSAFSPNAGKY